MPFRIYILHLFLLLSFTGSGQAIDNTLLYKNINSENYFRVNYENDFFSSTDIYYTQGLHLEVVAPFVKRIPATKLLLHPHFSNIRYGIGAEHDGYTPRSYSDPHIQYGDRPFAACLFIKSFLIATDADKKQRFSSALSIGVIGQAAGGMEMQTSIHRWLHDATPHGWPNQVHNDAIINYQAGYEKQLWRIGHMFSIDADCMARAGTLSDKAAAGLTLILGYFDSPYSTGISGKNTFRIYLYEHPEANMIGYDATLQGGVFNHTNPYTLSVSAISRLVFQNRFGFVLSYRSICLEYFQSLISSEFKEQDFHVWGGVQIASGI